MSYITLVVLMCYFIYMVGMALEETFPKTFKPTFKDECQE